jgi:hypothetical protein
MFGILLTSIGTKSFITFRIFCFDPSFLLGHQQFEQIMLYLKNAFERITEYQMNRAMIRFFNKLFHMADNPKNGYKLAKYPKILNVMKDFVPMLVKRMPNINTALLNKVAQLF